MQAATLLLLVRAILRLAAFSSGFNGGGSLAGSRIAMVVLDDSLVLLTCIISLAVPAGRAFGISWSETSPFTSSPDPETLPLRTAQKIFGRPQTFSISKPYPIASAFAPMTHDTAYERIGTSPPLTSPRHKPVYTRAPYDVLPVEAKQASPRFSPPSPGHERKPSWPVPCNDLSYDSSRGNHRLVRADRIWN